MTAILGILIGIIFMNRVMESYDSAQALKKSYPPPVPVPTPEWQLRLSDSDYVNGRSK